ncbi:MAG: universal stress protein [Caulobacteraceae bacterium]|nr:universal stress protein [Caulobacteraceae bacterium]
MEIKDILVFLEAGAPCEARLDLARTLAQRFGAVVSGLCASPEPAMDFADSYVIGPAAVGETLAHRQAAIARLIEPTEAAFRAGLAAGGCDCSWEAATPNTSPRDLALEARFFDLAILRRPDAGDSPNRQLAELAALASGTPCLFTPEPAPAASGFDHVVLAWNGRREAKRALDDSLTFMKAAARVTVVIADGEASAEADPAPLMRHLGRHGISAGLERFHAVSEDAGSVLLRACVALDADLLVMGAYGHSRSAELVLGGATRTVLAEAPLPVLMSH